MHAIFIPYGNRIWVEHLLRNMEAQKHLLKLRKGSQEKAIWIEGAVRLMPFGFVEYVFPEEDADAVLNTLGFNNDKHYTVGKWIRKFFQKVLNCKDIPEYSKEKQYIWTKDHVSIIPIGVRYDKQFTAPEGDVNAGWTYEGL